MLSPQSGGGLNRGIYVAASTNFLTIKSKCMVEIFKITKKNDRFGTIKTESVIKVDNYKQALERIEHLKSKNNKSNVTYITGNIYR